MNYTEAANNVYMLIALYIMFRGAAGIVRDIAEYIINRKHKEFCDECGPCDHTERCESCGTHLCELCKELRGEVAQ